MKTRMGLVFLLFSAALLIVGCDGAVTTNAPPPSAPTGLSVTAASSTELSVSWTAPAGGVVSGYKLYRDGTFLKAISATAASDAGLAPATRYCYTVTAYNAAGAESPSSESVCGTTLSSDTTGDTEAPSVPADLSATAASSTEISLAWSASTDNTGVAGYNLYRDGLYVKSVTIASASDTGLLPSTRYCYTVSAFDAAGNESGKSADACATTQSAQPGTDETPPTAPSNLVSTAVTTASISVSWTAATDNVGVAGYKIYRDSLFLKAVTETASTDTGLAAGTQYCYTVSAGDAAGNESAESTQSCATTLTDQPADTAAPSVPGSLAAAAGSATSIDLNWSASTDNVGVVGYKIYRDSAYLKSVTATTASDTGLLSSTQYCYEVSAYDAAGNESARTGQVCTTTQAPPDTIAPTITTTLPANGATNISRSTAITATFSEAMKSSTIDTTSFKVEYGSGSGVTGTVSYNAATKTATFTPSSNLAYSTLYTARVTNKVEDEAGNRMESNYTWSFTTTAAPDTTGPAVTSTNPANNATGVAITAAIAATLNESVDTSTVNASTFTVAGVTGTVSASGSTATFTPSGNLAYSTTYTATITGVKDTAGNPMAADYTWSFTTQADPNAWKGLPSTAKELYVAVDDVGNVYVAGRVSDSLPDYINAGNWDAFVAKYAQGGMLEWVWQTGTTNNDNPTEFYVIDGKVYLFWSESGQGTCFLSSFTTNKEDEQIVTIPSLINDVAPDNTGIYYVGQDGNVVKKTDFAGNILWSAPANYGGTTGFTWLDIDTAYGYATGGTYGAISGHTNAGYEDAVLAKFDRMTGDIIWERQWGTADMEEGRGVLADSSGISVVTRSGGQYGPAHYAVRRYDLDGNLIWEKDLPQFGGTPSGSLIADDAYLYIPGPTLVKLNKTNGDVEKSMAISLGSMVLSDNTIFATDGSNELVRCDKNLNKL